MSEYSLVFIKIVIIEKPNIPWKKHLKVQCILKPDHQERRGRCKERGKLVGRQKRIGEERTWASLASAERLDGGTKRGKDERGTAQ